MNISALTPLLQDASAAATATPAAAQAPNLSDLILLVLVGFSFLLVLLAVILWAVVQGYVSGKLQWNAPASTTPSSSANEPNSTH
jgi:hypothetical protein